MKTDIEEYEVTISYKAVITVMVSAKDRGDAESIALKHFENKERKKWFQSSKINLLDDSYKVSGSLNMDETWNIL